MKKWIGYAILLLLVGGTWWWFASTSGEINDLAEKIEMLREAGDPEELVSDLSGELKSKEGLKIFKGILLAILSAGLLGIVFVIDILPMIAHKATHAIYDSGEMVERDIMHDARSLFAQGEYESSVAAYREAAEKDPTNRFPWVEMAKIQKDNLHDPGAAIVTLREALESREWEIDDAAFFMFRLVDLYDDSFGERAMAAAILEQVVELFPETRHSANARHKLSEWEQQAMAEQASGQEGHDPQI